MGRERKGGSHSDWRVAEQRRASRRPDGKSSDSNAKNGEKQGEREEGEK